MNKESTSGTLEKALKINLDPSVYGSFAEIGAGQETANWFFRASGSAGTVAKSISAYDMTVSDKLYGQTKRYVSEERLRSMMECEYKNLHDRLNEQRGSTTRFFTFCDTVKAKGYKDNGHWHGWLGMRFQLKPEEAPSDVIVHVRLNNADHDDQMESLGILGVNLIYAVLYKRENMKEFVESLVENISKKDVEVDLLRFEGHGFQMMDNRLFALQLVESELTPATLFLPDGTVECTADVLYKKPIILMRGSFSPVTYLNLEMMEATRKAFEENLSPETRPRCLEICEITINNLLRGGEVDHLEFLDRADALQALGMSVLITKYARFHSVSDLLSKYTSEPIAIVLSIGLLNEVLKEKWYQDLPGGILEALGRLFRHKTHLYVYPWRNKKSQELVTAHNFRPHDNFKHLYAHLKDHGRIHDVPCLNEEHLRYTARDITRMIERGDETWKQYVPEVAHRLALHL